MQQCSVVGLGFSDVADLVSRDIGLMNLEKAVYV
jgi:hypothetical protein